MSRQTRAKTTIEPGATLMGRYVIERSLGSGGMGKVYLARQRPFDREVVIKVMHDRHVASENLRRRFSNEAQAASQLSHPNTITVYDFGQSEDGVHFIAMEYVEGRSLHEELTRNGPMSVARAVPLIVQVAQSLGEAHRKGIIHRDLKLENIMISAVGSGDEFAKVLDFGIAKLTEKQVGLTQTGSVFGTPGYMPPEQADGKGEVGATADLYALSCCLYELLTGRLPFEGESALSVLMKHQTEPPPDLPRRFPRKLDAFIKRGLAKQPRHRPQSADDYIAGLLSCFVESDTPARRRTPPSGVPAASSSHPALQSAQTENGSATGPKTTRRASSPSSDELRSAADVHSRPTMQSPVPQRLRQSIEKADTADAMADEAGSRPPTGTNASPARSGVPSSWVISGGAVAVAAGALVYAFTQNPGPNAQPQAPQAAVTKPAKVDLTVVSKPERASIFADGQRVGITPATLSFEEGDSVDLRLEKRGYRSETFSNYKVGTAADGKLAVPLEPATITVMVNSPGPAGEVSINGESFGNLASGASRRLQVNWPADALEVRISVADGDDYVERIPASALASDVEIEPRPGKMGRAER